MDLSRFTALLEKAFLEFRIRQTRQRLSVSLNSFASYLDFSPPIVNQWLNGSRLPTQGNVERLVPKLVELLDLEAYDFLGLPRPDTDLLRLSQAWPRIPKEHRQELADLGEKYAARNGSTPTAENGPAPTAENVSAPTPEIESTSTPEIGSASTPENGPAPTPENGSPSTPIQPPLIMDQNAVMVAGENDVAAPAPTPEAEVITGSSEPDAGPQPA